MLLARGATRFLSLTATTASREFPAFPIAAVAVTVRLGSKYLLVKRANEPGKGLWSLPGGSTSVGEPTIEAAARELFEETGIGPGLVTFAERPFTSTDAIYHHEGRVRFHYVISQCLAFSKAGSIQRAKSGDDADAVGWFTLDEMENLQVVPIMLSVVRQAEKLVRDGSLKESESVEVELVPSSDSAL